MRPREIRKVGNSWFIKLDPADVKDFELEEGEEIDIEPVLILKLKKKPLHLEHNKIEETSWY